MLATDENAIETALGEAPIDPATVAEIDADQLLQRFIRAMLFAKLRAEEAGDLERAIKARKQRYQGREELLRRELMEVMQALARKSFVAVEGTASVRTLPNSVLITDLEAIPGDYVDVTERVVTERKPRREAMLEDLQQGVVIEGAVLAPGGVSLTFRRQRAAPEAAQED